MYNAGDLRKGLKIEIDNEPYIIIEFQFSKPGKGQALYRCKLRNMITVAIIDRTYRSGDTFEPANLQERQMQYLYRQEDEFHFMDLETYDQMSISRDTVGKAADLLKENENAFVLTARGQAIGVELPNFVHLAVTYTELGVRGDTATGAVKPATLETGVQVSVPLFVNEGDVLKIDTRTGEYVERV